MVDLLIPGPEGKIEAKYSHNNRDDSPIDRLCSGSTSSCASVQRSGSAAASPAAQERRRGAGACHRGPSR